MKGKVIFYIGLLFSVWALIGLSSCDESMNTQEITSEDLVGKWFLEQEYDFEDSRSETHRLDKLDDDCVQIEILPYDSDVYILKYAKYEDGSWQYGYDITYVVVNGNIWTEYFELGDVNEESAKSLRFTVALQNGKLVLTDEFEEQTWVRM